MIHFYRASDCLYVIDASGLNDADGSKIDWLLAGQKVDEMSISGSFVGPRKEMITPWSTNAVEICENMGIHGITRLEQFYEYEGGDYDPMLQQVYHDLDQQVFSIDHSPEPVREIEDIGAYNKVEGLALSDEEVEYLEGVSQAIGRKLTDGEVFGFSQVNSEHCRHKIFNGTFVIDGQEMPSSLFQLIKRTSRENPNEIVSAYKDNVAFMEGPTVNQFAPQRQDTSAFFDHRSIDTVISLKAETHNFPTTVEPFNGAATGSGGEIRDRMAGGTASIPLAGTAVYMTSYARSAPDRRWENQPPRQWLYQTPLDILIKASNGASDFGNKFGQPLISGSLLTFEHEEQDATYGFDKVIMLAGGIGFGKKSDSIKKEPKPGDSIVVMGGDNYRIGMGGGSVSSVATGEFANAIELNAIQRSNPEMQKRVYNAIRAMSESDDNPVISLHDHGAGGHLNCLSELVETSGGTIDVEALPVGDPTLSAKEIIGNESQERMGLVIDPKNIAKIKDVAARERAPFYEVGSTTGDMVFRFKSDKEQNPIDLELSHFFGSSPKTVLEDQRKEVSYDQPSYDPSLIKSYILDLLRLEAVACKDWLTNKVDRSVTGKVATQQCDGPLQLPLNNAGVMTLSYDGLQGVATSIGHAPVAALINPRAGSRLAITEALTNIVWAPLTSGLSGVALSANWMWPAKNPGENARLYDAVDAVSDFAVALGINIPTGKDSMSMTQKYPDGKTVFSPGTVIISASANVSDIRKTVSPSISKTDKLYYVPFGDGFQLGGSSFAQLVNSVGGESPDVTDVRQVTHIFDTLQNLVNTSMIMAGHDIGSGGLITTLLEMVFSTPGMGLDINAQGFEEPDLAKILFSESPAVVIQANVDVAEQIREAGVSISEIATPNETGTIQIQHFDTQIVIPTDEARRSWYESSFLLDQHQTTGDHAKQRFDNFAKQPLTFRFPEGFTGSYSSMGLNPERSATTGLKAAIIREKGVNGDREMAYSMHLAGFDVKDVHMTDLISGRETLEDIHFIVFVGGFSNSDVLGSARGWAGAFLHNPKAKQVLDAFYNRPDTLSLGVCNGCQLMMELELLYPALDSHPKMLHNASGKFESGFLTVDIGETRAVMLERLQNTRLGVWVAHGEGKFDFKGNADACEIAGVYSHAGYPGNPNGSELNAAIVASKDGRHLAMMPHLERSVLGWQWPYSTDNQMDVTPWVQAFISARDWVEANRS